MVSLGPQLKAQGIGNHVELHAAHRHRGKSIINAVSSFQVKDVLSGSSNVGA